MRFRTLATALALAALSLGCPGSGSIGGALVVSSVEVTPGIAEVILDKTVQLQAAPKTSSGIAVTGKTASWSSTDQSIAKVSTSGLVTAMAVGGPVRIKATVDGVVGDAVITVRAVPVDHVTIDPPTANILVGGNVPLVAKAFDANSVQLNGRSFLWESNNTDVVAVTTTGLALGQKEGGPVTITATSEGKSATASVSVSTRPATRLAFSQQPGLTRAGEAMTPPVQVELEDNLLTRVIGAPNPVTIQLAGNPGGATLSGQTTVTPQNGIATFSTLSLNRTGISYTFLVTSPGLVPATSTPFDVIPGSANQLAFSTAPPGAAQSGVLLAPQPVLQLKDGSGNNVAQANVAITASIATGPAGSTLGGTKTVNTNSFGVASFTDLAITGASGAYTLSFGAAGVATLTSGTITLGAGGATALFIATQPSSAAQSNAPLPQQPQIQLRDAAGNNVAQAGITVTAAIASGGGAVGGNTSAITNGAGLAIFSGLSISGPAGTYTLGFSSTGLAPATSGPIVISAGAQTKLSITTQPSANAVSGVVLPQQPAVQLRDASNNPVAQAGVGVTAAVSSGSGAASGVVTAITNGAGLATFAGLSITGLVGNYTLSFSSPGLQSTPASNTIVLSAGAATQLTYNQQPSISAQSGVAFGQQPILQVKDAAGNPVLVAGTGVTATITGAPAGVSLVGTTTASTNASGAATFSGLGLSGTTGNYTLTFTAGALTSLASNSIALSAGGASQITYNQQPSTTANSGQAFVTQPILLLRDASNNPIVGTVITATITGAPAGVSFVGTTTATTNASGVATFVGSGLGLSGPVGNYSLTFTAGAVSSSASNTIALSAGTATQLSYNVQPSAAATSGVAFTTQPQLLLRDAANNPVAGIVVTATITGAPAGVALIGTTTATTNGSGVATFVGSGLGLSGTVGNYTLTFTAGAVVSAASNTIALSAGAPSQLTYTQQPSSTANSGQAFATQPILLLRDASNNPVAGVVVTATVTGAPAGVSRIGTTTATTNASGIATFAGSGLGLTGPAGNYTLTFTAGAVSSAASSTIALSSGTATQLTYSTQPSTSANSGAAFATQPALLLRDASNNPVPGTVVTATITGAPAGVSLVGTVTATTNGSGIATFVGLGLSGPVGSYTLTFTAAALTSAASNTIALAAGTATQLTYSVQPSTSATSGVAFATQPVLLLRDASNNPVAGTLVTASITGSPAGVSFVGTTTATTNASGLATFVGLGLSGPSGNYTLTFTTGAVTSAASNTIALTAGSGTQLTYNTQPSTTANSGQAFGTQPALLLRDPSNNPVAGAAVTATVTGTPAGVSFVGSVTATTNGSGVATFVGLGLSGPVGNYTLTFTSGSATSVASNTITLSAGTATQLTYNQQPSISAQSGVAFGQQPILTVRDAAGNPVLAAGTVVTATITGAPAGVSFVGTTTASTNASGVATFTNLGLSGTTGNYTLTFTAGALTSAASNTIALSAGGANQITYNQQPSTTASSGQAFVTQPILLLRDASNNPIVGQVITATITGAPAGVSLLGTTTATTNGSGVATFVGSGLGLSGPVGNYTLTFTSGAVSSSASNTIALSAGTATQLTYNTQPSTAASSGAAFGTQPVLLLRDAANNPVGGVVVTATITGAPAGVSFVGTTTATTNGSGLASFAGLGLSGPSGNYSLTFTASAVTSAASNTIALSSGSATQLTYNTQPSSTANSGAAFSTQPVPLARDASNNPVGGVLVTATITGAPAGVSLVGTTTATTNGSGLASFSGLGLSGPVGNYTLTFTAGAATSAASNSIALSAGAATQLTYNTQPSTTATSGAAFVTEPVLLLRDAANNPVGSAVVTATITGAPAGVSLIGTATATTNASGVATFVGSGLGLSGTAGNYTLTFTSGAATSAASNTIALSAGTATQLTYNTQPSSTANSGVAFAQQPVLLLRDASNNPVGSIVVTATITGAPAGVSLIGTTTATTSASGLATFSGLGLSGTPGNYSLTFTAGAVSSAASNTIALSAGGATQLTYNTQPSTTANSGQAFATQPALLLRDASNNPVGSTVVTATITGAPAGVALIGTTTATTNGSGVVTFSGLGLSGTVGNYTLTFTSGAVTSAASNSIALSAGTATQLSYNQQPSTTATSGQAFAQQPILLLRDASNNPVSGSLVTATLTGSPAGVAFVGTTSATTNASGIATFVGTGLGLSGTSGNYTLTFTAGAVSSPASNSIALSAGTGTQLSYNTQPSTAASSGVVFTTQPVLLLRDASNNPVAGSVVSATITGSPAGASLMGTGTATTNASGLATFVGLGLNALAGNYTLTFTAGAVTSAASSTITLSTGPASQLTYNTQPSTTANSGQAFGTQPVLLLRDTGNNPIGSTVVTATITGAPAGVALIGTTTATTNASGVATFVGSGLGLSGTVGNYTLTFTSGAVSSAASNTIALSAGTPTQLTYNTQPSTTANSGAAFATQPALLLRDAANNPIGSTVVTATITGAPAGVSFVGTPTATTNASGVATFSGLGLNGPIGNYTLTFTAGAVTSVASNSIALSTGAATQLTYNTQPSTTANSGQAFATQPVLLLRDSGTNPVGSTVVTATITGAPAGVSLIGTTTATTNASGVASFSGLGLSGTPGNYTLTFTAGAVSSAASNTIALSAGTPTQLTYNQQPSTTAVNGQAFATEPILLLRDAANNPVGSTVITATITGAPAGASLIGTVTATTNGSGVATFVGSGLGLTALAGNYSLTFTAGALNSAASNTIAVSAGSATQLTYNTQPSTTDNSGQAFATQPALLLRDSGNNPIGSTVVTATITGAPAGVSLIGTTTATTNGSGVATFSGLGLSGTAGNYTLTFTAGAVTSAASNSIALSAGTATQLTYNQQPSTTANSGAAFAQQPKLLLRDAANNPIGGQVVTATITGSPAGVSFVGTATATTNAVTGIATFTNLGLSGTPGNYTLTFTANAGALSSAASNSIALSAGTATQLTYSQQPSSTANSGAAFAQQPKLLLRDAANNPVSGQVVTATITGSPAGVAFVGTTTATTDVTGTATFINLGLSGTAATYTLTFTANAGALSSAASNNIVLSAGTATQLTITTQPSSSPQNDIAFAQQPAIQLRDGGNNPVSQMGVVVTAAIATGGGTLGGTLTATTDANGLATFTNLKITGTVGARTIDFTAPSVTHIVSGTITLTAGTATTIAANSVATQTATVSTAVQDPPSVLVTDVSGNPVSGTSVTFAVTLGGGTVLPASAVTTSATGIATATSWTVGSSTGTNNNTVTASASGLTGSPVTFHASGTAATQLTVTTQPSATATSNTTFAQQPIIQLRDGSNAPVSESNIAVTATIISGPGGSSLGGTMTVNTNSSGVAAFTDLKISGPSGTYKIRFASGNLTHIDSADIVIP